MATDLPPHAARVVRAAVALVDRRPSVPEAWREVVMAVAEWRRVNEYRDETTPALTGGENGDEG